MGFLGGVGWVIAVILFWAILFLLAFRFSTLAFRAPTEAELEHEAEEAEQASASTEHAAIPTH